MSPDRLQLGTFGSSPKDLATASALVAFCNSLGPALGIAIGQSIFTNIFKSKVSALPDLDIEKVINSGAADLSAVVPDHLLGIVRNAFNLALTRTFTVSIVSAGLVMCASLAMDWINVKSRH